MEQIIQHIAAGLVEKILNRIENGELRDLDALSDDCLDDCKAAAAEIITSIIAVMNRQIRKDKHLRGELGLKIQEHDRKRVVLTVLGEINYERDYYRESAGGQYRFPIDEILQVSAYERVGKGTSAKLVNMAADVSYQKAAELVCGKDVSRQTVKNKIQEAGILEKEIPPEKRKVRELHIHADEDHAHIQTYRQKGKRSKIVPYIVLTEGTETIYKSRNRTINAVHFADKDLDGKALWAKVSAYIYGRYEQAEEIAIYIHSDGGRWIEGWKEVLPNAIPVMDLFHFRKELKIANGRSARSRLSMKVLESISKENDGEAKEECFKSVDEAIYLAEGEKAKKHLREFKGYMRNNWRSIRNAFCLKTSGSCTEGQISHGLSERISRNPMGWSEAGLGRMAMLRAFRKNKCRACAADFRRKEKEKETSRLLVYSDEVLKKALEGKRDWSIFSGEQYAVYQPSGTQHLLRVLGRMREMS